MNEGFRQPRVALRESRIQAARGRQSRATRGPGQANTDLSLIKDTRFAERFKLQFRAEYFNAFNRPQFGEPDSTFGDTTFGVISGQVNSPRQIQFGLKLFW